MTDEHPGPAFGSRNRAVECWREHEQAQRCHAWRWRPDPTVVPIDGARGSGLRRGEPGLADFPAGSYPACSRHGAMTAVGGEIWRCLIEGCNTGGRWAR
jgi:hypothetical protein